MKRKRNRSEKAMPSEKLIFINCKKNLHTAFKNSLFSRVICPIHQHTIAMFLNCKGHREKNTKKGIKICLPSKFYTANIVFQKKWDSIQFLGNKYCELFKLILSILVPIFLDFLQLRVFLCHISVHWKPRRRQLGQNHKNKVTETRYLPHYFSLNIGKEEQ